MKFDSSQIGTVLSVIDRGMTSAPAAICLIGSGATILLGQIARRTDDLNVWSPASEVIVDDFKLAVESAGLSFNPNEEHPDLPYVRIIHPGIVQVPGWNQEKREWFEKPERIVWRGANLTVTVPPPSVIVASKLIRGDRADLEDCVWLITNHAVEAESIMQAIKALPQKHRQGAKENFELLKYIKP